MNNFRLIFIGYLIMLLACQSKRLPFVEKIQKIVIDETDELISQPIKSMEFVSDHEVVMIVNQQKLVKVDLRTEIQQVVLDTLVINTDSIRDNFLIPQFPTRDYSKTYPKDGRHRSKLLRSFYNNINSKFYVLIQMTIPYTGMYDTLTAKFMDKQYMLAEIELANYKVLNYSFINPRSEFYGVHPIFQAPFYADDSSLFFNTIETMDEYSYVHTCVSRYKRSNGTMEFVRYDTFVVKNVEHIRNHPDKYIVHQRFVQSDQELLILQQDQIVNEHGKIIYSIQDTGYQLQGFDQNQHLVIYQKEYDLFAEYHKNKFWIDSLPLYPQNSAVALNPYFLAYVNRDSLNFFIRCLHLKT